MPYHLPKSLTPFTPTYRHAHQDENNSELRALVATFKNMTGLWDIDPEDSAWYHLEQRDKNDPGLVVPMGSICYRYDHVCLLFLVFIVIRVLCVLSALGECALLVLIVGYCDDTAFGCDQRKISLFPT